MKPRCAWATSDPIYIDYHDNEWGNPQFNDQALFELLNLEGAQAGLSWITILRKRENYREAFADFNPEKIARFNDNKRSELLNNAGIVRNRLKINAFIENAKAYLTLQDSGVSFSDYLWEFVDHTPIINHWQTSTTLPTQTPLSQTLSNELKKKGFRFVGPTICYAFMQAAGMVNDHTLDCFLRK